jgi:hypothetical protein
LAPQLCILIKEPNTANGVICTEERPTELAQCNNTNLGDICEQLCVEIDRYYLDRKELDRKIKGHRNCILKARDKYPMDIKSSLWIF